MNRAEVETARAEALRFIDRCDILLVAKVERWTYKDGQRELTNEPWANNWTNDAPKEQGAVKRSSMDLTRALADLRRR